MHPRLAPLKSRGAGGSLGQMKIVLGFFFSRFILVGFTFLFNQFIPD